MRMEQIETPWGPAQTVKPIAEGLDWVSTAGHGGIRLSPARWLELQIAFPHFRGYAGPGWLEEDLDWALAAILWPQHFSGQSVWSAARAVQSYKSGGLFYFCDGFQWIHGVSGRPALAKAAAFAAEIAGQWERGGLSSHRDGWSVSFYRDGTDRTVLMARYPEKDFYTTEELDALTIQPSPIPPGPNAWQDYELVHSDADSGL